MPTRDEIEAVRWTREQLAKWGVPWPPPKGWKSRLQIESACGVARYDPVLGPIRDLISG